MKEIVRAVMSIAEPVAKMALLFDRATTSSWVASVPRFATSCWSYNGRFQLDQYTQAETRFEDGNCRRLRWIDCRESRGNAGSRGSLERRV
jgi:hypothetical protein